MIFNDVLGRKGNEVALAFFAVLSFRLSGKGK
jgi:hypothetical protein